MLEFKMPQGMKKNHDPLGLVPKHCALVGIQWPYIYQIVHEELRFQNVDSLRDVFPVRRDLMVESVWDSSRLTPEQTQHATDVVNTTLQLTKAKLIEQVMQHNKGKVSIVKLVIIDTDSRSGITKVVAEFTSVFTPPPSTSFVSPKDESIVTPGILDSALGKDKQFLMIEYIPDIEFLAYNQQKQTIVKQRKITRSISWKVQENIVEEPILDLKRTKLIELVEEGIIFNQETLDKSRKEGNDIQRLERRICELEEKLESEKKTKTNFCLLKEYLIQSSELRFNKRRIFYEK